MRLACLFALLVTLAPTAARAESDHGPFGIGLIVGQPTGLTMEFELSEHTALDAAVGFDLFNDRRFYAHLEFLYFLPTLVNADSLSLALYIGVGGFIVDHPDRVGLGVRAPLGLSLEFTAAPIEIFAEVALHLLLVPDVDADPGAALGIRYYF